MGSEGAALHWERGGVGTEMRQARGTAREDTVGVTAVAHEERDLRALALPLPGPPAQAPRTGTGTVCG